MHIGRRTKWTRARLGLLATVMLAIPIGLGGVVFSADEASGVVGGVVNDPPLPGTEVIAFPARDFVAAEGFVPGAAYTVRSVRAGVVTGESTPAIASVPDGLIEVNHPGGACWVDVTPNLQPGDLIQVIDSLGNVSQTTIANVKALSAVSPAPGTIEVHGTAQGADGLPLDVTSLEQRMIATSADPFDATGGRTLRADSLGVGAGLLAYDAPGSINWTATYSGLSAHDVNSALNVESRIMWLGRNPLLESELTIFEVGDAVFKGPERPCTAAASTVPPPEAPELGIVKSAVTNLAGDFVVGAAAAYELTISNTGTADEAGETNVFDELPAGLTLTGSSSTDGNWNCAAVAQLVTCTRPASAGNPLEMATSETITLNVAVDAAAIGTVTNNAQVSGPGDTDPANNRDAIDTDVVPAVGLLRVTTSPAVPSQIYVDGIQRVRWGLDWMKIQDGPHDVCFGDVEGWQTPSCQAVVVGGGATSFVQGAFVQNGSLRVTTSPAVASTISIDGVPHDDWEVWNDIEPGLHEVCFGDVADHTLIGPECQFTTVTAGGLTTVTGMFNVTPGTNGQNGSFGLLRVTTQSSDGGGGVASEIIVDGIGLDRWALTWMKIMPGAHTVCFSDVTDFTTPPCQNININKDTTTSVLGMFTRRGILRVVTQTPHDSTIFVNGIPRNDWGAWMDLHVGSYEVCFGESQGFAPACQTANVALGAAEVITGMWP